MGGPAWLLKLPGGAWGRSSWGKAGPSRHQLVCLLLGQHDAAGARGRGAAWSSSVPGTGDQRLIQNQNQLCQVSVPWLCRLLPGPPKCICPLENPSEVNELLSPRARSDELVVLSVRTLLACLKPQPVHLLKSLSGLRHQGFLGVLHYAEPSVWPPQSLARKGTLSSLGADPESEEESLFPVISVAWCFLTRQGKFLLWT